jgi:hypothetical protein
MLVVQGITNEGKRFRPSTWMDMLVGRYTCSAQIATQWGTLSSQESQTCITISKHISVCCCNNSGACEIQADDTLERDFPAVYNHIKNFAISNNLKFTEIRGGDSNEE